MTGTVDLDDEVSDAVAVGPAMPLRRRRWLWRAAAGMVVVALGAEGYAFRHRIDDAFGDIRGVDPWWAAMALTASLLSMHAFARAQRRMLLASGADVPVLRMVGLAYTANAVNWTFPGGSALSIGYIVKKLRSWGVSGPAAAFALAASSALSSVTFVGLTMLCAAFGAGSFGADAGAAGGLAVLIAGLVFVARRPRVAVKLCVTVMDRANRTLRFPSERMKDSAARSLSELIKIRPRRQDWMAGAAFATVNWAADLLCLLASCRAVGLGHTSTLLIVSAYVAGMTASTVSLVPGGFGVVDLAMVIVLVAGGLGSESATAGVLLYRLISCALLVVAGWVVWLAGAVASRHAGPIAGTP